MTTHCTSSNMDAGKTPEQLFGERVKRVQDVMQMKQPDRIPIFLFVSNYLSEFGGVNRQELYDNIPLANDLLVKIALLYQPDQIIGLFDNIAASRLLGDQMIKIPGYGLGPDGSFQFLEQEFMTAEDYDAFLEDPADFGIRTYLPRAFTKLAGLAHLPPLGMSLFGYYNMLNLGMLASAPVAEALNALNQAVQKTVGDGRVVAEGWGRLSALGFPPPLTFGSLIEAPFDFMSDTLRGMRGIFLDMLRRPEKLLAAEEKVARFQIEHAVNTFKANKIPYTFIPLHRGSDGFMSLDQFERFYWPQLKDLYLKLIENGITPFAYYEGIWDERLKYLAELPKGKTAGYFQNSNIFKVKEVLGDIMAIVGGMPNSLLQGGTVEQVRECTKRLCREVGKRGGFMMSTSIGEMEGSKPELIQAWVDATREYGVY